MYEDARKVLKDNLGVTDEDFTKHITFAHNRKILEHPELLNYKIVAEVTGSKYCSLGLQTGQKFVLQAFPAKILIEESTAPFCLRALGPIAPIVQRFWERICEGIDPNNGMWQTVECLDPGIERGGLGNVKFKVYAQRTDK